MKTKNVYIKIVVDLIFAAVILLLLVFLVPRLIGFFFPFLIGYVIALLANPLVRFLENRLKILRKHGSVIVIIVALTSVIAVLYFVISAVAKEMFSFVTDLPSIYQSLHTQISAAQDNLQGVYNAFPKTIQVLIDGFGENINDYASKFVSSMELPSISDASMLVKNAAEFLFMLLITIMSAYFFVADRDKFSGIIKRQLPESWQMRLKMITDNFKLAFGGYFKAQIKIMLVIAVILYVGFCILGTGYSVLLALGIAFLDFLPFFGTGAVLWPWAVVELVTGNYLSCVILCIIYLVCQIVRQILQPKLVGDSIGISPMQTLIFMYIGYKFKGLLGIIIGIPIGMIIVNFYKTGAFNGIIEDIRYIAKDISSLRERR